MIADVVTKRARRVAEQAREGGIDGLCLSESKPHVEDGLDEDLDDWHSTVPQMVEVGRDARGLITDGSGGLAREDCGGIGEREGLGPRQRVGLAPMRSSIDQGFDGNFGDVPDVDEGGSTGAGGHEEAVVVKDVVPVSIAEVLSEEAWTEDGPAFWSVTKVLLDGVVGHERVVGRTRDGKEDDLAHAFRARDVQKRIEGSAGVGDGRRTKQENGMAAVHRGPEGARVEEIQCDGRDAATRTSRARLSCAGAKRDPTGTEAVDDR